MERVLAGTSVFQAAVPYRLYETGGQKRKPLIVYLHGFRQNIDIFKKQVQPMLALDAYHLFIQGPYPLYDRNRDKKIEEWGRAWYLYDGRPDRFVESLEQTAQFLEQTITQVQAQVSISRTAVTGYSMGGYQAGYFGLSRSGLVDELVVMGSRIKTEVFKNNDPGYDNLKVLALHGRHDRSVQSEPQRRSCAELSGWGADVTFAELETGHRLSPQYFKKIKSWLFALGYQ